MAKKRKVKRGLSRKVDALVEFLIYESTSGNIGHVPAKALAEDGSLIENKIPFHTRAKFADSAMKYVNGQAPSTDDDEEDGIASFRERLNGDGGTTGSGADSGS
jgi:hypothetical protein